MVHDGFSEASSALVKAFETLLKLALCRGVPTVGRVLLASQETEAGGDWRWRPSARPYLKKSLGVGKRRFQCVLRGSRCLGQGVGPAERHFPEKTLGLKILN